MYKLIQHTFELAYSRDSNVYRADFEEEFSDSSNIYQLQIVADKDWTYNGKNNYCKYFKFYISNFRIAIDKYYLFFEFKSYKDKEDIYFISSFEMLTNKGININTTKTQTIENNKITFRQFRDHKIENKRFIKFLYKFYNITNNKDIDKIFEYETYFMNLFAPIDYNIEMYYDKYKEIIKTNTLVYGEDVLKNKKLYDKLLADKLINETILNKEIDLEMIM